MYWLEVVPLASPHALEMYSGQSRREPILCLYQPILCLYRINELFIDSEGTRSPAQKAESLFIHGFKLYRIFMCQYL